MKNLPKVIVDLIRAQDNFDSKAYISCFTETALVYDEGQVHTGKLEIQNWIEKANKTYHVIMKPIEFFADSQTLKAEISGSFPSSPLLLMYEFVLIDQKIQSLKIV